MTVVARPGQAILGAGLPPAFEASVREAIPALPAARLLANARHPRELFAAAAKHQPDLVLVATSWVAEAGLDLLARLHEAPGRPAILLQGKHLAALATVQALRLGLRGVLATDAGPGVIAKALAAVLGGEFWFSHGDAAQVLALLANVRDAPSQHTWRNLPALTDRENAVLMELLSGRSNREISNKLGISEQTVKVHLQHVFLKLGVHRRTDLLAASALGVPED